MKFRTLMSALTTTTCIVALASPATAAPRSFNIPAGSLKDALDAFVAQSGMQLIYKADELGSARSPGATGVLEPGKALNAILQGSGFKSVADSSGALAIVGTGTPQGNAPVAVTAATSTETASSSGEDVTENEKGIAEILVVGSRTQNVDIRRTRDDAQPYLVIDSEQIRNSGATNIDDLLRTRVPMNAQSIGNDQTNYSGQSFDPSNKGKIDLRGLGPKQTLILVDGRRVAGIGELDIQQGSIAGIAIQSIDRVEILPATAGAIYGGSAVGGVVNIILKHDYKGIDVEATYGNTTDWKAGQYSLSINGGYNFGKLKSSFSLSRTVTSDLELRDRAELVDRSQALTDHNNQGLIPFFPPLGTSTNFCGTETFFCDGTQLTFDNGAPYGASFGSAPVGYAGVGTDAGAGLLAGAGRFNRAVPDQPDVLIRGAAATSLNGNLRYELTPFFTAYLDAHYDTAPSNYRQNFTITGVLPANDPANPFQQDISIQYIRPDIYGRVKNRTHNSRLTLGGIARLPHSWAISIEDAIGKSLSNNMVFGYPISGADLLAAQEQGLSGNLTSFKLNENPSDSYGPITSELQDLSVRASGPVFDVPGGKATISSLLEQRHESTGQFNQATDRDFAAISIFPAQRQTVRSAYVEATVPIFSSKNEIRAIRSLEVQGSLRHDYYQLRGADRQGFGFTLEEALADLENVNFGASKFSSTDYLVAGKYEPFKGLGLRASFSTGFLPPGLSQITPTLATYPAFFFSQFRDPKRGNEPLVGDASGDLSIAAGGSPQLMPELSKSFSVGTILSPSVVPGLRISVDYTNIHKKGEFFTPDIQFVIDNEANLPGRIRRGNNLPSDPAGYAGPITYVDFSLLNSLRSNIKALDIQADYSRRLGSLGDLHAYFTATRAISLRRQVEIDGQFVNHVGFSDGPLRFRANFGAELARGPLTIIWNAQYYSSYRGVNSTDSSFFVEDFKANQGTLTIPPQVYNDVGIRYDVARSGPLNGITIIVGLQNIFNARPPAINSQYGLYSSYGDPRLRRFTVSLKKHFGL